MSGYEVYPHLLALVGRDQWEAVVERSVRNRFQIPHPLASIQNPSPAGKDLLGLLDVAAGLLLPVLEQAYAKARDVAHRLGSDRPSQVWGAVAELVYGARLQRLGLRPEVVLGRQGQETPDFFCTGVQEPFYVEVYAPHYQEDDGLLYAINKRLDEAGVDPRSEVTISFPAMEKREPGDDKIIADHIKASVARMRGASCREATFQVPSGADLRTGWALEMGSLRLSHKVTPRVCGVIALDPSLHIWSGSRRRVEVFDGRRSARQDLSRLGQVQYGDRNVLVVDMSTKMLTPTIAEAYWKEAGCTLREHPKLSAVIFTWRSFRPAIGSDGTRRLRLFFAVLEPDDQRPALLSRETVRVLKQEGPSP